MTIEFANYLSMPSRVPVGAWRVVRRVAILVLLGTAIAAIVAPANTLSAFWGLAVPVLPLVFLVAPGSWRNVCPLAGMNQTPRELGVSSGRTAPAWIGQYGFAISTVLFFGIALSRKVLFNRDGTALGVLLLVLMAGAFAGGWLLKGKSGWCSSICPLLPVQRVYGQAPFVGVPNGHCRPCLGCTQNCYDFNPRVAYVADMHEPDAGFRGPRRLFVGAFPGFVVGYFVVPDAGKLGVLQVYGRCLVWMAGSIALFALLDAWGRFKANTLPPVFGATAFSLFYWYGVRKVVAALHKLFHVDASWLVWPVRVGAIALAAVWLWRALAAQRQYLRETMTMTPVQVDLGRARSGLDGDVDADGNIEIQVGSKTIAVKPGTPLLEAILSADLPIEVGCRMGVCGADPVAVPAGYDALSPIRKEEADTLERLGLGAPNRMACVARAQGRCSVSLAPDRTGVAVPAAATFEPSPEVRRVVIVGNGIGGVTAADFLRRHHPECDIDIVGLEPHQFYNRMGIARLIHGRSAMQGLYLLPADWYDKNRVTLWLNTRVVTIDREAREVRLGTGQRLAYDKLVLATGGEATKPPIEGFGIPGCFVLREADDAMRIRSYVQERDERRAIVAGGGLLGLEAAHSLWELGLSVTVLERSARLLRNSLDATASSILLGYFEALGIQIMTEVEVASVEPAHDQGGALGTVVTKSGQRLAAEVLLVAAGVTPSSGLAARSGLSTARGILVDERLRTSDPDVYAVGDAAEFNGHVWGLWPVAVEQAQIAAVNIAGGDRTYSDDVPTTVLKGVGLDMLSFGQIEPATDADVVIAERSGASHYRKLVVRDGRVVGGMFLGFGEDAQLALDARDAGTVLTETDVAAMQAGDWSSLGMRATEPV